MDEWDALDEPWRACLELGWEAYLAGTIPIGSVVVAPDGTVLARGRNRVFEEPGRGLAGSRLAHAEVEALAQLPAAGRYRDHALVSGLEPCLLCTAAALHATVGRIEYAAADPFGGGCSGTIDTVHWRRSRPEIAEPLGGWPGRLSSALQCAFWIDSGLPPADDIVAAFGEEARRGGERIRALEEVPETIEEALPRLLDCL